MRVTQSGTWTMVRANLSSILSDTRRVEEQAVTGLLMNRASDAPELRAQVDALSAAVADQSVYERNATQAMSALDTMDSALSRAHDALARAREIALQMAGDTVSAEERALAAEEIDALRSTIIDAANAEYGGRYLFAGTAYDALAFDEDGNYAGSTDEPSARVGENTWVATGRDGSAVFTGGIDVFAALADLQAALESDDDTGVSDGITDIDTGLEQLVTARAEIGNTTNVAEDALSLSESLSAEFQTRLDDLAAADPAETYTKLSELRSAYSTALQVAASGKKQSLFDLL
ncbi:MAG: hypothetical protein FJ102_10555 [Deltaproteobacteria bacterium]|nr:hypothetical protein [Deltaproteobacteria bacterium]